VIPIANQRSSPTEPWPACRRASDQPWDASRCEPRRHERPLRSDPV